MGPLAPQAQPLSVPGTAAAGGPQWPASAGRSGCRSGSAAFPPLLWMLWMQARCPGEVSLLAPPLLRCPPPQPAAAGRAAAAGGAGEVARPPQTAPQQVLSCPQPGNWRVCIPCQRWRRQQGAPRRPLPQPPRLAPLGPPGNPHPGHLTALVCWRGCAGLPLHPPPPRQAGWPGWWPTQPAHLIVRHRTCQLALVSMQHSPVRCAAHHPQR